MVVQATHIAMTTGCVLLADWYPLFFLLTLTPNYTHRKNLLMYVIKNQCLHPTLVDREANHSYFSTKLAVMVSQQVQHMCKLVGYNTANIFTGKVIQEKLLL